MFNHQWLYNERAATHQLITDISRLMQTALLIRAKGPQHHRKPARRRKESQRRPPASAIAILNTVLVGHEHGPSQVEVTCSAKRD